MAGFMESVATINSTARTLLALVLVGLATVGGWIGYRTYNKADIALQEKDKELEARNQRISALEGDLVIAKERAEKLETALRLMKVEHRLARVDVLDQVAGPDGKMQTTVEFTEINDQGNPIGPSRKFTLAGKSMHVEGWVVKFEDRFIEAADPERGMALFAFKSIYGNEQKPIDGFPLDKPGERPTAYGGGRHVSDFEQQIWDDFWNLAHDPEKKAQLGARSLHGTTQFVEARKGWRYKLNLRAAGDIRLDEEGEVPNKPGAAF